MPRLQVIILSRDPIYSVFLEMTIREHGFHPRLAANIELVERWSTAALTVAWFIDLDQQTLTVEEVAAKARLKAPDAKLIFLSSRFDAALAQSCIRQQALALLVKPIVIPRLIQCLNSLRQEVELLEHDEVLPSPTGDRVERDTREAAPDFSDHPFLRPVRLTCPICGRVFEGLRFKLWTVPVSDTDTDFCPICPERVHPELYTAMVCPGCLFAHYVGKFEQTVCQEALRLQFLSTQARAERRQLAFNLDFQGERTILHGIKSFELAARSALDLKLRGNLKLAGEFYLKCSWLCRRVGHRPQERQAQEQALECLSRAYAPYRPIDDRFPSAAQVAQRMEAGQEPLNERGIAVTGFLVGELHRRLGHLGKAQEYFKEVLNMPFLHRYSSLLSHIHAVARALSEELQGHQPRRNP
ncbi:MAG: DUF2225 domain-containing protein [Candidatus Ozemobacter sibiricus]|jgi:CheY-like chemotaxis protein|uniref:DUF2225 domain-containing protein n=1 Tax=Candidatus Ozemobacter sibiricus TaxID=2268124 RepID=A0A367ZRJ4_9BACT|nr:MAG: DUF2225 domain-containing protein [Candidatus Ozemobacter sibiricus]